MGASFGGLLSQPVNYGGGDGFGMTVTSLIFLAKFPTTVAGMTFTVRRGS